MISVQRKVRRKMHMKRFLCTLETSMTPRLLFNTIVKLRSKVIPTQFLLIQRAIRGFLAGRQKLYASLLIQWSRAERALNENRSDKARIIRKNTFSPTKGAGGSSTVPNTMKFLYMRKFINFHIAQHNRECKEYSRVRNTIESLRKPELLDCELLEEDPQLRMPLRPWLPRVNELFKPEIFKMLILRSMSERSACGALESSVVVKVNGPLRSASTKLW